MVLLWGFLSVLLGATPSLWVQNVVFMEQLRNRDFMSSFSVRKHFDQVQ